MGNLRKCRIRRLMLREGIRYHTYLGIPERPTGQISINILWTFPHGASAPALHLYNSQVYSLSHAAHVLLVLLFYLYRQTWSLNWQRLRCHLCEANRGKKTKAIQNISPGLGERVMSFPKCVLHLLCCQARVLQACTNVWIHYSPFFTTSTRSSFIAVRKKHVTTESH